jgi:hypothetical protein
VTPYDASEAKPSEKPFFQCTIKPISYAPSFPFSTAWFKYFGIDESLVHPPLPQGRGESQELAGTDKWCKLAGFSESSNNSKLAWADMSQRDEDGIAPDEFENFFPGLRRWNLAVKLTDATVFFPPPETWETPKWLA